MSEKRNLRLKDQAKRDKVTNELVIKTLMSSKEGRRWVWVQLEEANVFSSSFAIGPDGDRITAFKEGRKAFGLALLTNVTALAPNGYLQMTSENAAGIEEEDERSTEFSDAAPE